jgi:hypothetical protein
MLQKIAEVIGGKISFSKSKELGVANSLTPAFVI